MIDFEKFLINKINTIIFDFDGVFTDNKVFVDCQGNELVRCDRSDAVSYTHMTLPTNR